MMKLDARITELELRKMQEYKRVLCHYLVIQDKFREAVAPSFNDLVTKFQRKITKICEIIKFWVDNHDIRIGLPSKWTSAKSFD